MFICYSTHLRITFVTGLPVTALFSFFQTYCRLPRFSLNASTILLDRLAQSKKGLLG